MHSNISHAVEYRELNDHKWMAHTAMIHKSNTVVVFIPSSFAKNLQLRHFFVFSFSFVTVDLACSLIFNTKLGFSINFVWQQNEMSN